MYGRLVATYSPSSEDSHIVRLTLMYSSNIRHTRTIVFPDPVAEVGLSDDVMAVITTKGELYTIAPHAALSSPDLPFFAGGLPVPATTSVRRHLYFVPPPRVPFVFSLCVDRKTVYAMAFAAPARELKDESADEVARPDVVRKRLRSPPPRKANMWTRAKRALHLGW